MTQTSTKIFHKKTDWEQIFFYICIQYRQILCQTERNFKMVNKQIIILLDITKGKKSHQVRINCRKVDLSCGLPQAENLFLLSLRPVCEVHIYSHHVVQAWGHSYLTLQAVQNWKACISIINIGRSVELSEWQQKNKYRNRKQLTHLCQDQCGASSGGKHDCGQCCLPNIKPKQSYISTGRGQSPHVTIN